jgi:acetolactate synthase small subunit
MAEGIDNLLAQLDLLVSQNNSITATVSNLQELKTLVNDINAQGTAGLSSAQQAKLKTAQALIKSTASSAKQVGQAASAAAVSTNDMTESLKKAGMAVGLGALTIGAFKLGKQLDDVAFKASGMDKVFKTMGVSGAEGFTDAFVKSYDEKVVPVLQQAEDSFASLFGEAQQKGTGAVANLGFDLRQQVDQTAAMADKLGRSLDNTTNSLRFLPGGLDGAKAAAKLAGDQLTALMPVLFALGRETNKISTRNLATFQNALNLSSEELLAIGQRAAGTGNDVSKELMMVERTAKSLADATGLNRKQIGDQLANLRGDFMRFGNVSTAELGKVVAKAMSLGVELSKLKGLEDTFDDFEKSADSVAVLSQALGVNIDAFKLFETEDPTERLMMIREAFLEAGQDINQMNRRERRLLANIGIDPQALAPALSPMGAGQETGEAIRRGIEGVDTAAVEASFQKFNLRNAETAEKYFEDVAALTTRNIEGIQKQFENMAQNLVLSRDNRQRLTDSFAKVSQIPDIANDAFSKIGIETGKVSKAAIDDIALTSNRFSEALFGFVDKIVEKGIELGGKAVDTLAPGARARATVTSTVTPARATTVSPAAQQSREVNTQQQAQAAPQEITLTVPVSLQMNEIEFGSGIAQAKLPGGLLGKQLDNINLQLPNQPAPNVTNSP